jgi:hypothetical protein
MDQIWNCERAARNPNHAVTYLRESGLSQPDVPPQHIAAPAIDFCSPDLWTEATQKIIDDFPTNLQRWTISYCLTCSRTHPFSQSQQLHECRHCILQRRKGMVSKFGMENDMDPGLVCVFPRLSTNQIPEELRNLTQLEEMLIARIYPLMTVYTFHGGQRKGSKHIINFSQNLSWFTTTLPQKPEHIPLTVHRLNLNDDKHYDFRVRRVTVRRGKQGRGVTSPSRAYTTFLTLIHIKLFVLEIPSSLSTP